MVLFSIGYSVEVENGTIEFNSRVPSTILPIRNVLIPKFYIIVLRKSSAMIPVFFSK